MIEFRKISKRFGRVQANDRIDITVEPGTIHAIVGENGAGKSTAMRIAYGLLTPDSGDILIDGRIRVIARPLDAIALGVGMVHQHFTLVDTMTVAENIVLGAEPGHPLALDLGKAASLVRALSAEVGLTVDPAALVEHLSPGQQQHVEILKALYRQARLLILDEPTSSLAPQEVDELFALLRRMRGCGKTIVIITHKLAEVLVVSDDVTAMRDGRVVGRVRTNETSEAELARLMVGRDVLLRVDKPPAKPGPVTLGVRDLSVTTAAGAKAVDHVSLEIRAGEIVGIAGIEGNGQTELLEALAGLIDPAHVSGELRLDGTSIGGLGARSRRECGIAYIPEDRHGRGLVLDFGLDENAILGVHHRPPVTIGPGRIFLDKTEIRRRTSDINARFGVRPPDPNLLARVLSGGNQQKLVIGREFALHPRLLLVSQPTRGVDIGAIEFIHGQLVMMRDCGCAVLLVSGDLEEVTSLADRLLIIRNGHLVGEVDPKAQTFAEIGLLMTAGR